MRTTKKKKADANVDIDVSVNARLKENMAWLKSKNISYDVLLETAALFKSLFEEMQVRHLELTDITAKSAVKIDALSQEFIELIPQVFESGIKEQRIKVARAGAYASHKKDKEKQEKIRSIWASGKYSSRDICAEQECAALGMSFSTARKALRNTPNHT